VSRGKPLRQLTSSHSYQKRGGGEEKEGGRNNTPIKKKRKAALGDLEWSESRRGIALGGLEPCQCLGGEGRGCVDIPGEIVGADENLMGHSIEAEISFSSLLDDWR